MLREMSKFDGIESSVKMSMQENALKFEKLAIGVCKQAQQKEDAPNHEREHGRTQRIVG